MVCFCFKLNKIEHNQYIIQTAKISCTFGGWKLESLPNDFSNNTEKISSPQNNNKNKMTFTTTKLKIGAHCVFYVHAFPIAPIQGCSPTSFLPTIPNLRALTALLTQNCLFGGWKSFCLISHRISPNGCSYLRMPLS